MENYISIYMTEKSAKISLTSAGKDYLISQAELEGRDDPEMLTFKLPYDQIWGDLFANRAMDKDFDFELLNKHFDYRKIGALTDAPIFGYKVRRGDPLTIRRVFWFPNYQVSDELGELLFNGSVEFEDAGQVVSVDSQMLENEYEHCGQSWSDTWSCGCDDECPVCDEDVSPVRSTPVEDAEDQADENNMKCNDCGRPISYDEATGVYKHLEEPTTGCFLIPSEVSNEEKA